MLILLAAAVVVAAIPLLGGRYSALGQLRLRGIWLVTGGFIIQILIMGVIEMDSDVVARSLHLLTYAMIGVCIVLNRQVRWMWVVGVGWASNVIVIAANGGVMPTSASAARTLGRTAGDRFENSAPLANPRLEFLGDVFVSPSWLPMRNAFSVGDVILIVGLALVVWSASRAPIRADSDVTVPS